VEEWDGEGPRSALAAGGRDLVTREGVQIDLMS